MKVSETEEVEKQIRHSLLTGLVTKTATDSVMDPLPVQFSFVFLLNKSFFF